MGYRVEKRGAGWRVVHKLDQGSKGTRYRVVSKKSTEFRELGFVSVSTFEDARELLRRVQADDALRTSYRRLAGAEKRLQDERAVQAAHVPEIFERDFLKRQARRATDAKRFQTQWRIAKKTIEKAALPVEDWSDAPEIFYRALAGYSADYVQRLLTLVNEWGRFVAKKTGRPFLPVRFPRGSERQRITDAFYDSGKARASQPLRPEELEAARAKLSDAQFNWLWVAVWFGLRPAEVDSLKDQANWRISEQDGETIFWVYQRKLITLAREERWKLIPVLFAEQWKALAAVKAGTLDRPLVKTIAKHVKAGSSCYAGRKGFVRLMRERGRSMNEISHWLGHRSEARTRKNYEERLRAVLEQKRS